MLCTLRIQGIHAHANALCKETLLVPIFFIPKRDAPRISPHLFHSHSPF